MKFVIICSYLPSILNFRGELLEAIKSKGFEIHILAPDLIEYEDDVKKLKNKGYSLHSIKLQRTGKNPIADFISLFSIFAALRAIQPDYLLTYTIKPVIYGILAGSFARVKNKFVLITGLGYAFQNAETGKRSIFQRLIHKLYSVALAKANKVFFQNLDDKNLFLKLGLLDMSKPAVIVNGSGVNVSSFDIVPLPKDEQGKVKISFLLIARLLGGKGIREYIQSAEKIKNLHSDVQFHLVGWIDDNPDAITQTELDDWVNRNLISYWGKLSDVRLAIETSSVYVLPSYREGTPRTVLEAMAMGRPVITTDAPGCRETVEHGRNGYLVEIKSVEALTKAMLQFIDNPKLVEIMGNVSREIVLEKYDVHKVNHHMLTEMGM